MENQWNYNIDELKKIIKNIQINNHKNEDLVISYKGNKGSHVIQTNDYLLCNDFELLNKVYAWKYFDKPAPLPKLSWRNVKFSTYNYINTELSKRVTTPYGIILKNISTETQWKKACSINVVWNKIQELNNGWEPDFNDIEKKWYLYMSFKELDIASNIEIILKQKWQYLKSKKLCIQLKNEVEEETLKLALIG